MRTIILYGEKGDSRLTFPLCRTLERYGGVLHLHGGNIGEYSDAAPEFLLYETDTLESIQLNHGLLLFKESAAITGRRPGISGLDAVILPDTAAPETHLLAIRCGTSSECAVMLSSLEEQSAAVTLGQTLQIGGRTYEPHDIHIRLTHPIAPYPLMACSTVLMVSLGSETESILI